MKHIFLHILSINNYEITSQQNLLSDIFYPFKIIPFGENGNSQVLVHVRCNIKDPP